MPALPGAHHNLVRSGDAAIFHARACSRPPEPSRRIFMRSAGWGFQTGSGSHESASSRKGKVQPHPPSFRGVRSTSPESILPIVVMDSGPAPSGASRNDTGEVVGNLLSGRSFLPEFPNVPVRQTFHL